MSTSTIERAAPASPSAGEQIDKIASTFSLAAEPNDIHGDDLRQQLLTSYAEWLGIEQRLLTSELWPTAPKDFVVIPANTRWGDWHYSKHRFPGAGWYDGRHPLERAAFVLWAVGAIDDIHDPLRDLLAAYEAEGNAPEEYMALGRRLAEETPTPTTMAGATAALKFVLRSFEDGEHIADRALVEAVIRFLEREDPTGYAADPDRPDHRNMDHTEGNIEWWRDADQKFNAFPIDTPDEDPDLQHADEAESRCWNCLIKWVPTTLDGLKAWSDVMHEKRERIALSGDVEQVLASLQRSVAHLQERAS